MNNNQVSSLQLHDMTDIFHQGLPYILPRKQSKPAEQHEMWWVKRDQLVEAFPDHVVRNSTLSEIAQRVEMLPDSTVRTLLLRLIDACSAECFGFSTNRVNPVFEDRFAEDLEEWKDRALDAEHSLREYEEQAKEHEWYKDEYERVSNVLHDLVKSL